MKFINFRVFAILILLLVSLLILQRIQQAKLANPLFSPTEFSRTISSSDKSILFESQLIPQPFNVPSAHSSSFITLANGDLLAFWFAGSKEGNADVQIWMSRYHNGVWSTSTPIVNPAMVSQAVNRYVVKVGNPVVYLDSNNILHLFVVSVSVGGWSGSSLNHLTSTDDGQSWSLPERIVVSPFFNISTLVRTSAISLTNGGFYLPVYHEFIRKYPELLRFDSNGNFVNINRITNKNRVLQPSLVPLSSESAVVYLRNSTLGDESKNIYAVFTHDGGLHWDKPVMTNLLNNDSSVVGLNLRDGRYLMIYNQGTRGHLWLAISTDQLTWHPIYQLESNELPNAEYSYPDMHLTGSTLDITYTYNRKEIKHVRLSLAWLNKVMANK